MNMKLNEERAAALTMNNGFIFSQWERRRERETRIEGVRKW